MLPLPAPRPGTASAIFGARQNVTLPRFDALVGFGQNDDYKDAYTRPQYIAAVAAFGALLYKFGYPGRSQKSAAVRATVAAVGFYALFPVLANWYFQDS